MPVYLEREFREMLFAKCYHDCGSLGEMGKRMGYSRRPGINGTVRDMWLGTVAIPGKRIEALATLASTSSTEIFAHKVPKEQNVASEDWRSSYERFLRILEETQSDRREEVGRHASPRKE